MNATEALTKIAAQMGSAPRPSQIAAIKYMETAGNHAALRLPTGTGKSAIAAAIGASDPDGAMIMMFSNGLVNQYVADAPIWAKATGKSFAAIVGSAHYWCQKALSNDQLDHEVSAKAAAHIRSTGTFIGSGLLDAQYVQYSVKAVSGQNDPNSDDDETTAKTSPCKACPFKDAGCALWDARRAAAEADVVVTNVTLGALALKAMGTPETGSWLADIGRRTIIVDEAHAAAEPIQSILGTSVTLSRRTVDRETADRASRSATDAMNIIHGIASKAASDSDSQKVIDLRIRCKQFLKDLGRRTPIADQDIPKSRTTLIVPVDLKEFFAPFKVIAMSGTLTEHYVTQLGLTAPVKGFAGLDVSGSTVMEIEDFPKWRYPNARDFYSVTMHNEWAQAVAEQVTEALRNGGRTLLICQSNNDLDVITNFMPDDIKDAMIIYKSGVDRLSAVKTYRANPDKHFLAGFASGAGVGLNLPHDLLRTVIVSRVPASAPQGANRTKFMEDTKSAVVQSVGRGHRADDDWAVVRVLGGFGTRSDIRQALIADGWVIS